MAGAHSRVSMISPNSLLLGLLTIFSLLPATFPAQIRSIVESRDYEALNNLLNNKIPSSFKVADRSGRVVSKTVEEAFFELSPPQQLVDLFIQKRRTETLLYCIEMRANVPDSIIDSPIIDSKKFVTLWLESQSQFIERVIERRFSNLQDLSFVELDNQRLWIVGRFLDGDRCKDFYSLALVQRSYILWADLQKLFENFLKNIWLELLPVSARYRPDVIRRLWENTHRFNLQQTKKHIKAFKRLLDDLLVAGVDVDAAHEIASSLDPEASLYG